MAGKREKCELVICVGRIDADVADVHVVAVGVRNGRGDIIHDADDGVCVLEGLVDLGRGHGQGCLARAGKTAYPLFTPWLREISCENRAVEVSLSLSSSLLSSSSSLTMPSLLSGRTESCGWSNGSLGGGGRGQARYCGQGVEEGCWCQ